MSEFGAGFWFGFIVMFVISCAIIIGTIGEEEKACRAENNVYDCKRVYLPQHIEETKK